MGSTTISGGGNTDHHGFHVYGGGPGLAHSGAAVSGNAPQSGFGNDTISLGSGHDTLVDAGRAAGAHFGYHVSSHSATMAGGAHHASFIGAHSLMAHGGAGSVAGGTSHVTALFADHKIGTDVIKTFVAGHDKLHLESQHLSYLHSHVDMTVSHGATTLKLDGGHTTIALKGFTHIDTMGHK